MRRTVAGNLNIDFGADDANTTVNGGTTTGAGDRAVTFAADAIATLNLLGLTSQGDTVTYALNGPANDVLTASAGGRVVFTVELFDTATGSYLFDLVDVLDHAGAGTEDDIDLTFNFTATDSDGDSVDSSFQVTVDDNGPVIGAPASATVDEDDLSTTNAGGADLGDGATGYDAATDAATVTDAALDTDGDATTVAGNLNIDFGADDANTTVNGGTTTGAGDRAVTFAADAIATLDALNLTSQGRHRHVRTEHAGQRCPDGVGRWPCCVHGGAVRYGDGILPV